MLSTSLPVKPQREGIKKFFIHMSGTGKSEFLPQTLEQRRKGFRVPDQIRKTMYCTFLIHLTKAEASEKIVWRVSSWSKGSPMVLYKKNWFRLWKSELHPSWEDEAQEVLKLSCLREGEQSMMHEQTL